MSTYGNRGVSDTHDCADHISQAPPCNQAAERLRGGLEAIRDTSTDSASRQLADSLLALLAVHDAAERRAMLSLLAGPDDRVTGADYKRAAQTLADYRAEERRATVERIRDEARRQKIWSPTWNAILDKEAAR